MLERFVGKVLREFVTDQHRELIVRNVSVLRVFFFYLCDYIVHLYKPSGSFVVLVVAGAEGI